MINLKKMDQSELLTYAKKLADEERRISLQMVNCLREVECRMTYAELGYSSLFVFAVEYLGLSEDAAQLRISAMRLGRDHLLAKDEMESGRLSLSNAAQLETFFRAEKKRGKKYSCEEKSEIIQSVMGLSKRKCQLILLALAPEALPGEKQRPLTPEKTEIRLVLDERVLQKFETLRAYLSHSHPQATFAELIEWMLDDTIGRIEKKKYGKRENSKQYGEGGKQYGESSKQYGESSAEQAMPEEKGGKPEQSPEQLEDQVPPGPEQVRASQTPKKTPRVYISVADRQWVNQRSEMCCEYVSPDGRRCGSRFWIQLDHRHALYNGGLNERSNYRNFCSIHNKYAGLNQLGRELMGKYVDSLKGSGCSPDVPWMFLGPERSREMPSPDNSGVRFRI